MRLFEPGACHTDLSLRKHDHSFPVDFDHLHIELITDQGIAVGESHRPSRVWVRNASRSRTGGVLPYDGAAFRHLDDPVVQRVRDERVSVFQTAGKGSPTDAVAVLPDNVMLTGNFDPAIVVLFCH